ncbi:MAG: chromosomal replication initiator protein DnaA [Candidatus Pacebacteria bacterium]|jgi:chromosomal replication initiator protein|nr:chromosomal replication initiator protein DnaA [Candidatus Paceibacterota bacterium]|tara:strand:- start:26111 stop:27493 length:1383 start_codon:yes stop_codon:yes gene_type:complete
MNETINDNVIEEVNVKELWENALVDIELNISKANFSTWFKDTHIIKIEGGVVCLSVQNEFVKDWLFNKYHKLILKILRSFVGNIRGIEYLIKKEGKKELEIGRRQSMSINKELPLNDYYPNKEDNLNPRYTFESFVVGPFNELAHVAAQAIVEKPGITYNPLFIYGGTGHGKTHLIQSVGNQLKKRNPDTKVYYTTSEKFAQDYINAVRSNKVNTLFKEKYRKYDVLIIDDIQFLSNMEKTREELFHLFNALYDNNKQIVFSSDTHPNMIPNLEGRLKSRFSAGMIADIPSPDHESRIAILKAKSLQNKFIIENEIVNYLALTVQGNIRELEGTLNSIICQSQLKGKVLSLNDVKALIKNNIKSRKSVSVKDVIKQVAGFYNLDESVIYKKTRVKEVVKPRQLIMYILREDFHVSYPTIGQKLGGRDHTTVIHSCDKIKRDLKIDSLLSKEVDQIRAMLN